MQSSIPILNSPFAFDVFTIIISLHLGVVVCARCMCSCACLEARGEQPVDLFHHSLSYSLRQFLSLNLEPQQTPLPVSHGAVLTWGLRDYTTSMLARLAVFSVQNSSILNHPNCL